MSRGRDATQPTRLVVWGRAAGRCQYTNCGEELAGEFLRVGRIALMFKTPDDSTLLVYDPAVGDWTNLNRSYLQDVKYTLRMAKEQTAPDIVFIPVKPPVQAQ